MQSDLPLVALGQLHTLHASGAQVDFANGTIRPAHYKTVGLLIGRVLRYGVMRSLRPGRSCTVLFHSALVGNIAAELARSGHLKGARLDIKGPNGLAEWTNPAIPALLGMYGSMHDVGEIFGGDVIVHVPPEVRKVLCDYQSNCRNSVMDELGIPLPSPALRLVLAASDLMAVIAEKTLCENPSSDGPEFFDLIESKLAEAGITGVDIHTFGISVMRSMGVEGIFPQNTKALRLWKQIAAPSLVLLSQERTVVGAAMRSDSPDPEETPSMGSSVEWIRGFRVNGDMVHDMSQMHQKGSGSAWPLGRRTLRGLPVEAPAQ